MRGRGPDQHGQTGADGTGGMHVASTASAYGEGAAYAWPARPNGLTAGLGRGGGGMASTVPPAGEHGKEREREERKYGCGSLQRG